MAAMTIRNIPEETHRALKVRAKANGRSTEAEVRAILQQVAIPAERLGLGTRLATLARKSGALDLEIERDKTPARIPTFE